MDGIHIWTGQRRWEEDELVDCVDHPVLNMMTSSDDITLLREWLQREKQIIRNLWLTIE